QNPVTGLCPGDYNVLVADQHLCSDTAAVSIYQFPPQLVIEDIDFEDISCYLGCDGSAQAGAGGGTPPYFYLWSNGSTTAGIDSLCYNQYGYQVTVTDNNGCTTSSSVNISQPGPIYISLTEAGITCHSLCNGSISGSASGGTWPYSFGWSTGATGSTSIGNLCAGTYQATVTDGNLCTGTASLALTEPDTLIVIVSDIQHPACFSFCEGAAEIALSGGTSPYIIHWSNDSTQMSVAGLCAGAYSVTVTDENNCTASAGLSVLQPSAVEIAVSSTDESSYSACDGSAVASASGGTPPYFYVWSQGTTDSIALSLCEGTYYVSLTDAHDCPETDSVTVHSPPTYSLCGRVYAGTNPLPQGVVLLYADDGADGWHAESYINVSNGQFCFDHLSPGIYLTYAVPYFDVPNPTPVYMPTYNGNRVFWTQSESITVENNMTGMDIFLVKNETILYGNGSVSGSVVYSDPEFYETGVYGQDWFGGYKDGDKQLKLLNPARNITLLILNAAGTPLTYTLTDSTGVFSIGQLPYQTFRVYPQKAGYTADVSYPELNAGNPSSDGIDYTIIENAIVRDTTAVPAIFSDNSLCVYPNPFTDRMFIDVVVKNRKAVTIRIFNTIGCETGSFSFLPGPGHSIFPLSLTHLTHGMYIVRVSFDDRDTAVFRIVK
ncbi:MAG: T9SS type A sorting domain-containing protein, partial [Bacteroidetes bacterium]|nr:T9SS type A sorting domain-containing protein [Bacteroidota bacterium]